MLLPKLLFSTRNVILYAGFGGFFSIIFQFAQSSAFVPLQAVAIGAAWPANLVGFTSSQTERNMADAHLKEMKD